MHARMHAEGASSGVLKCICAGSDRSLAGVVCVGSLQNHGKLLVVAVIAETHPQVGHIGLVDVIAAWAWAPVVRRDPVLLYLGHPTSLPLMR